MKTLKNILDFFLCLIKTKCEFSLSKFLSYIFTGLAIYLAITNKIDMYSDTLILIGGLLGVRSLDKWSFGRRSRNSGYGNESHMDSDMMG